MNLDIMKAADIAIALIPGRKNVSIRLAVFQASGAALSTEKGGLIILKTSLIWSDEALMRRTIDDNKQQQPLLNL